MDTEVSGENNNGSGTTLFGEKNNNDGTFCKYPNWQSDFPAQIHHYHLQVQQMMK